jgi:uncharacterized membrane protein
MPARHPTAQPAPPRWVPVTSLVLSLVGLLVAAYLTVEHFTSSTTLACPETSTVNCAKVTTSSYAAVAGVPVAVWGLAYFAVVVALCLPQAWRATSPWVGRVRVAAVAVGALTVLYLVWVELFRVNAICLWCTAVHVVTLSLFAVVVLGPTLRSEAGARP